MHVEVSCVCYRDRGAAREFDGFARHVSIVKNLERSTRTNMRRYYVIIHDKASMCG